MTRPAKRPVRFLFTRVATGGSAVAVFVSLWGTIAATAGNDGSKPAEAQVTEDAVLEQDGWRWDPATNQWVAIVEPAPAVVSKAPAEQIVIVERQPIIYQYHYITETPKTVAAATGPAALPGGLVPVALLVPLDDEDVVGGRSPPGSGHQAPGNRPRRDHRPGDRTHSPRPATSPPVRV